MRNLFKKIFSACAFLLAGLMFVACTSGGADEKFAKALGDINSTWQLYEVKKEGDNTIIKVEVSDVVSFDDGQKAMKALQAIDPQLTGYIEFYNSEVGMVLRKVEVFPSAT